MQRKSMLISGIFLAIIFSFAMTFSMLISVLYAVQLYLGDSFQIITDLIGPLTEPVVAMFGAENTLYCFVGLVFVTIFVLTAVTRFIKYSKVEVSIASKKRGTLIFSLILLFLFIGAQIYLFVTTMDFTLKLTLTIVQISLIAIEFICFLLAAIGISRIPHIESTDVTIPAMPKKIVEEKPAIYTSGLDEEPEAKQEQPEIKQEPIKPVKTQTEDSLSSQKLIDGIGKLDKMRKEGAITAAEYTRLRGQMIKKFVK